MSDPVILTGDEVIKMNRKLSFINTELFVFRDMDQHIQALIQGSLPNYGAWTTEGVDSDVLCPGTPWRKGKLRLVVNYRVEFIPDLPEVQQPQTGIRYTLPNSQPPLDDFRSNLEF